MGSSAKHSSTTAAGILVPLCLICGAIAAWAGFVGARLGRMAAWEDAVSPTFEAREGASGEWRVALESGAGTDRVRPIVLRPGGWPTSGDHNARPAMSVRVTPSEVLVDDSRVQIAHDGWIERRRGAGALVAVVSDRARVESVRWRIDAVDGDLRGTRWFFEIPGQPDSEHPSRWMLFAAITVFFGGTSLAFGAGAVLALRPSRNDERTRALTMSRDESTP